jgi:hypothetical protein
VGVGRERFEGHKFRSKGAREALSSTSFKDTQKLGVRGSHL